MPRLGRLGDLVRRPDVRRAVAQTRDLRPTERASAVAGLVWTELAVAADPVTTLGLAAFAIASDCAPDTWLMRPSAARLIEETDLHAIPSEPPRLLRRAGVVEAHRPETGDRLWGDYVSLAWFATGDALFLFGVFGPEDDESCRSARWTPSWTGQDLEPQLPGADIASPYVDSIGVHHEFAMDAARHLVTLGLLGEIEDSPLRFELDRREQREGRTRRDVYLRNPAPRPLTEQAPALDPTGRVVGLRPVTGHIRRFWCGPGRTKLEWRYIEQHAALRWLSPRWLVSRADDGAT